jgi:hypothetical protein
MAFDAHTTTTFSADDSSGSNESQTLWQSVYDMIEAFHGEKGLEVVVLAREKAMDPNRLLQVEVDGPFPASLYPVLRFSSEDPRESFVFSRQGAFRRVDMLPQ